MIGIGIDSIEINRFKAWHHFSNQQLLRIFSPSEIAHCREKPFLSAQRFAARFASKEALFKAWYNAIPNFHFPFLRFCKAVSIEKGDYNEPRVILFQELFPTLTHSIIPHISITHTKTTATAIALLEFILIEKK